MLMTNPVYIIHPRDFFIIHVDASFIGLFDVVGLGGGKRS